jgi:hypothetical protein
VLTGTACAKGHLNRPGMSVCARCARPIGADAAYGVNATRPALGCLVVDDGSIYRLDSGYVIGSDPTRDSAVRSRMARPLVMAGTDVEPAHAEMILHDWDVLLTDRGSSAGTFVFDEDQGVWERLRPFDPRILRAGAHIAFGQRVATFLTPWLPGGREAVPPPD